jgi:ankyrin repeat protein
MKSLFKKKEVNSVPGTFCSDLSRAIKEGRDGDGYTLLERSMDVNIRNSDGTTPLFWAIAQNRLDWVTLLIERGAKIDVKDLFNRTPVSFAKDKGYVDIAQILSLYDTSDPNDTPLMRALNLRFEDKIPELLNKTTDLNAKNKDGDTVLILAAKQGRLPLLLDLLSKGVEVGIQNKEGYTASQLAMQNGHTYMAQLLLHYQAVHAGKQGGDMPFLRAVRWGYEDIIPLLLLKAQNKEARNQEGNTALLLASRYGRESVVSLLLKHSLNIHARNKKGDSALSLAAKNGYFNIALLLIEEGADLNNQNNDGDSPLVLAAKGSHKDLVSLLLTKGSDVPEQNFSRFKYRKDIAQLITRYQSVGIYTQEAGTPLIRAVDKGYFDLTQVWVERGADLNARNEKNETPLMIAVGKGDRRVISLLIKKGASLDSVDNDNKKALTRARKMWFREKTVGLLIKSGASIIPRSEESEDLKSYMLPLLESCLQEGNLVAAETVFKTCLETYSDPQLSASMHAVLKQFFLEIPKLNFFQRWFNKIVDFLYPKKVTLREAAKIGDRQSAKGRIAYESLVSRLVINSVVHQRKIVIEQIVERSEAKGRDKLRQKLYAEYELSPPGVKVSGLTLPLSISTSNTSPKPGEVVASAEESPQLRVRRL